MSVVEKLKEKLMRELNAVHVEIVDDSWRHAGHASAPQMEATHLNITVVSPKFVGINLMDQHRMVNDVLKEARETHLHALQLKTQVPSNN